MILFISSIEIINVVHFGKSEGCVPDPNINRPIAVADAAVVNPNWIKTLLANGLTTFFIKGNPGSKSLPTNPLIVLFYTIGLLIISYYLMNYLQKFYNALKLVY